MKQISLHTFGCKVNTYDTGLLQQRLNNFELAQEALLSQKVHVVNSCAVTQEASQEAARLARKLKKQDPNCLVVLTGCAAQVDGQLLDEKPELDAVVANSHKGNLEMVLNDLLKKSEAFKKVHRSNIFLKKEFEDGGGIEEEHTRAFLKIQDGCNSFCTYCVIPFARGRSRSLSVIQLVQRVQELLSAGVREVVLTGVHIGDYQDGQHRLEDLIETLLKTTAVPRLRLTSLEPPELTPRLLQMFVENKERLCPHFHMSIQSVNSNILAGMKRQYDQTEVVRALTAIENALPDAYVGMDLIVGFPGESDEDFQRAHELLQRLPWTRIHVFPYSERPGTKAIELPDSIERRTRLLRASQIRNLSTERFNQKAKEQMGSLKKVIVLRKPSAAENLKGLSSDYYQIRFSGDLAPGQECLVRVVDYLLPREGELEGQLLGQIISRGPQVGDSFESGLQ